MIEEGYHLADMIARSASLSLHKSLIGVAQLYAIEIASNVKDFGSFRTSKALLTYYSVYHLFTASILLSGRHKPKLNEIYSELANGKYIGKITAEQLGNESEQPDVWRKQKKHERDMATLINHSDIKEYCLTLRTMKKQNVPLLLFEDTLFDSFIEDELKEGERCIIGLYEKLCYVRDRVLYRPSFVLDTEGHLWQTSKDVRREVDSLPSSDYLYTNISKFIQHFISNLHEQTPEWWLVFYFCMALSDRNIDELLEMGHTKEEIERLLSECGFAVQGGKSVISVTPHISQLLELESADNIIKWHNKYWSPLFNIAEKALFRK